MYEIFRRKFKVIYGIDLFGKPPELYFKGKPKKVSFIGTFLTLLYFVLYVVIFVYKLIKMINKDEVTFYETYAYSDIPSIHITNEIFYGGFALGDPPFIDETIYYPEVKYYRGARENGKMIYYVEQDVEVEVCKPEKFSLKYQDLIKDLPLNNLYCVKNMDFEFEGYGYLDKYSYVEIKIYRCNNQTKEGIPCQNLSTIDKYLYTNALQFYFQDIDLTPEDYDSPTKNGNRVIVAPIFKNLYQKIFTYLQVVIIETDKDIIGLKDYYKNDTQKLLKYEESWVISSPNEGLTYENNFPLCEINIQLSEKVLTQKRKNIKLIDIFGDVGGTMEFLFTVFSIISSFLTDKLYITSLVNNLFFFETDKKLIYIKNNNNFLKNFIPLVNKSIILTQNKSSNKLPQNLIFKNEEIKENSNNNNLKKEKVLVSRVLNTKRRKKSQTMISSFRSNETGEIKSQTLFKKNKDINKDNNKDNNNNEITINELDLNNSKTPERKDKDENIDKKNINYINKIIINKISFIFCYLCFRKKKDIKNILLDEGEKIIKEKLDIRNIFKKVYKKEKFKIKLNNTNYIEMSDECKQKINAYKNELLNK